MDRTVGIIGGMGPAATVEFMRRIVEATPATDDAGHIRMLVDNNPKVPSRLKAIVEGTGESPLPALQTMARGLQRAGADFLAIPCNTAHFYLAQIREAVAIPVLDMVALTLADLSARRPPVESVGLLASPALRRVGLLDRRFEEAGVRLIHPDEAGEAALERIIRAVKGKGVQATDLDVYDGLARDLTGRGADLLLIACTELSMIRNPAGRLPVLDTLDPLVRAIVSEATGADGHAGDDACHLYNPGRRS